MRGSAEISASTGTQKSRSPAMYQRPYAGPRLYVSSRAHTCTRPVSGDEFQVPGAVPVINNRDGIPVRGRHQSVRRRARFDGVSGG